MKHERITLTLLFAISATHLSCKDVFQFNPKEVRLRDDEKDLNQENIEKLKALPQKDTFSFILTGDPQRFYDDPDDLVNAASGVENVDFLVFNGDTSP